VWPVFEDLAGPMLGEFARRDRRPTSGLYLRGLMLDGSVSRRSRLLDQRHADTILTWHHTSSLLGNMR
jgi:hypothetical protein